MDFKVLMLSNQDITITIFTFHFFCHLVRNVETYLDKILSFILNKLVLLSIGGTSTRATVSDFACPSQNCPGTSLNMLCPSFQTGFAGFVKLSLLI